MIIRTSLKWITTAELIFNLKQQRKELEALEAKALEELKMLSEEQTSCGGGYLFAKEVRKGSVDYGAIPGLRGVDLDTYRKEDVTYFKLSKV